MKYQYFQNRLPSSQDAIIEGEVHLPFIEIIEQLYELNLNKSWIKSNLIAQQFQRSWFALFESDFTGAEKAANRVLTLSPNEIAVRVNLGHSQLLMGKYTAAKSTYETLKGKKDGQNKAYKQVILGDFDTLQAAGITHKDMPRMKVEIEKW